VTRGWLPQRAGSPYLNGGGAAAAVPPPNTVESLGLGFLVIQNTAKFSRVSVSMTVFV